MTGQEEAGCIFVVPFDQVRCRAREQLLFVDLIYITHARRTVLTR
jgi:hypothetical protein